MTRSARQPGRDRPSLHIEESGRGDDRQLVIVKNGERFVFGCAPGEEPALLARLGEMVRDPKIDLDWFDAAVLSHQIGQRMGSRLQRMQKTRA